MIDVIANRYAEALFQIGEEENKTDNLYNELKEVSSLMNTNKDLNNVMKSPLVSKKEKIQLIDTLFAGKVDNDLKNFLKSFPINENRKLCVKMCFKIIF